MKRKITLFIAAAALSGAALVAAAFGDTSSAAPPQASKGTLVALGKTALGKVLVDARESLRSAARSLAAYLNS